MEAVLTHLITKEEVTTLDYKEINERINTAFKYDDFAWQKDRKIRNKLSRQSKGTA